MLRDKSLQQFCDRLLAAYELLVQDQRAQKSLGKIADLLRLPAPMRSSGGKRLDVCSHLDRALDAAAANSTVIAVVEGFKAIEPLLQWQRRSSEDGSASPNFRDGHANAMIFGPGGIEERSDLWIGISLMAPNVRYPDHNHPPEESYLVLSPGEFRQGDNDWFSPGIGGTFYNPPRILHAMRSLDSPLLAFWSLLPENN